MASHYKDFSKGATLNTLAQQINPVVRGRIVYYGCYHRSAFHPVFRHVDRSLLRWAARTFKRFKRGRCRAWKWLVGVRRRDPGLFAHWAVLRARYAAG